MEDPFIYFRFSGEPILRLLERERLCFAGSQVVYEGTIRACAPERTLERNLPHARAMGMTRLARLGGLDSLGLPVSVAYRPLSRHLSSGQGKGFTQAFADASAVMECIEGFHIEQPAQPVFRGSPRECRSRVRLVDINRLSPGYFAKSDIEDWTFDWVAATNLLDGATVHVPACLATLDFSLPVPEAQFLALTSNGLASGNLLAEAICHGLLEVIERHCLATFERMPPSARDGQRIDRETIPTSTLLGALQHFEATGHEVVLWDLTDSLGIPTFNCALIDRSPASSMGWHGGSGTHVRKEIAAMRALTEAAQARAVWISGSRDDLFPWKYEAHVQRKAGSGRTTRLLPGSIDFAGVPSAPDLTSFHDCLAWLCRRLEEAGFFEVLVINHTRPEFNIPVVQVFVPGMGVRHDR